MNYFLQNHSIEYLKELKRDYLYSYGDEKEKIKREFEYTERQLAKSTNIVVRSKKSEVGTKEKQKN